MTPPASAPTARIQATLQSANTALVSWQTTNATSASVNGVAVGVNGSTTVAVDGEHDVHDRRHRSGRRDGQASATVTPTTRAVRRPRRRPWRPRSSGSRVTLNWRPGSGGSPATEYLLYVSTTSWGQNVIYARSVGNVLTVSGDLPNGRYYARVRARNAAGTSTSSNQVSFIVGKARWPPPPGSS